MTKFVKGDAVRWNAPQVTVDDEVVREITAPIAIEGHQLAASPANPEYLVKSDRTGAMASHKPAPLTKK